jgi:hypothetical protein
VNHPLPANPQPAAADYEFVDESESEFNPAADARGRVRQDASGLVRAVAAPAEDEDPYEQYRRRIMQQQGDMYAQVSQDSMPPFPTRPLKSSVARYERYFHSQYRGPQDTLAQLEDVGSIELRDRPTLSRSVITAGLAAIIAGGALGFAIAHADRLSAGAQSALAFVNGLAPVSQAAAPQQQPEQDAVTTISKKPIATASLDVADVAGELNSVIPLSLRADAGDRELAIRISGLPQSAFLSAGTRLSDNAWLLKQGEEKGVSLIVPTSERPRFDLSVAAIEEKTGELAAPIREMSVALAMPQQAAATAPAPAQTSDIEITPANALPETAAAAIPEPKTETPTAAPMSAEVSGLIRKGDTLFKSGDLVMARQFYARAFEMGAGAGAYGVARTYDPLVFKEMSVQGLAPEPARALEWYAKAKQAGIAEAEAAMGPLLSTASVASP